MSNVAERQNKITVDAYDKKYQEGYGLQYPEGHVIRFHRYILEHELNIKGGNILDYGCGNGVHSEYFQNNDFVPFGCDTSETAIKQCKKRLPQYADNFFVIPELPNLSEYFSPKFDLIFSNQVLYFFNDKQLSNILKQFHSLLKKDGILFATMMAPSNYYSRYAKEKEDGLTRIELFTDRLHEINYINFKTREEVSESFAKEGFKKLHIGWYSCVIREQDGPSDHWLFVGKRI